jgi:hypothetical protein
MTSFSLYTRVAFIFLLLSFHTLASTPPGINSVSRTYYEPHLRYLASDELEGREATFRGQRMAADFIASVFGSYGLEPAGDNDTFFQKFHLLQTRPGEHSTITVRDTHQQDEYTITGFSESFLLYGATDTTTITAPIVFANHGIISEEHNINDYTEIDAAEKIVLVLDGYPVESEYPATNRQSRFRLNNLKINTARQHGAAALLIIADTQPGESIGKRKQELSDLFTKGRFSMPDSDRLGFPMGYIDAKTATRLLGNNEKIISNTEDEISAARQSYRSFQADHTEVSLYFDVSHDLRETENVLALLPGTDPMIRDEYITITAHYDHLGTSSVTGDIYYGADDNASGTAGMLELARIFSGQRESVRRSILFIAFTAEEKGLLGSRYYTDNPVVPLEQTIVNLNLDMIGRIDTRYAASDDRNYVYLIGSDRLSTDLHSINEQALSLIPEITPDYRYNDPDEPNRYYFRSDHYNFIRHNVPAIFYFTGIHEDYHRPTDTADKIEYDRMENILRLIYVTAWKLAETETRPLPDLLPSE